MKKLIIFMFIISTCEINSQTNFIQVSPSPTPNILNTVHFVNELTGYAAGNKGTFIKTTDGGVTWKVKTFQLNQLDNLFHKIVFPDIKIGFAFDHYGSVFKTIDAGENFVNTTFRFYGTDGMNFMNKDTGFVYGKGLYRTTNGGDSWDTIRAFSQVNLITDLKFFDNIVYITEYDNNNGWNFSYSNNLGLTFQQNSMNYSPPLNYISKFDKAGDFVFAFTNSSFGVNKLFISSNNGVSWRNIDMDSAKYFNDLVFFDENTGVLTFGTPSHNSKILKTTDRGKNWQTIYYENNPGFALFNAFKLNSGSAFFVGNAGLILKTTDKGNNWIELSKRVTTHNLNNVSFSNQNTGIITGKNGTVLRTTNRGTDWTSIEMNTQINFNNVSVFDDGIGFITGDTNGYYRTTDFGLTWQFNNMSIYGKKFYSSFISSDYGAIVGGYPWKIVITTNAGANWSFKFIGMPAGPGFPPSGGGGNSGLLNIKCIGVNQFIGLRSFYGSLGSSSTALQLSINGGESWEGVASTTGGYSNYGVASHTGLPTGFVFASMSHIQGNIFKKVITQDLFQNVEEYIGEPVYYADFINPQKGIGLLGSFNNIAITSNSGQDWYSLVNSPFTPNEIKFIDENTAIAIGNNGSIFIIENIDWTIGINNISSEVPSDFILHQNYPNPFNPVTNIKFSLPTTQYTVLKIFDITGREIATLVNEQLNAGEYNYQFNADDYGISSGVYFYQLYTEKFVQTKKLILLK